ncbi:aldo/keto reductase [Streptomyces sp. NPDC088794]|uniref:aldo/keto reductase n=1 Tax=Streptomyces sp. NPDC088794 TaxID=3365902 RepID=UPI0037F2B3BE
MQLDSYRTLGRSGLRVSPITLGTMAFGDPAWGSDDKTSTDLIEAYLEAGGNVIDTANGYTEGASERIIGDYLAAHPDLRDRVVISTKFARGMFPGDPNGGGAGRKAVIQQAEASLRRLRTDYIDLYWQHCWDRHTPLEETLTALDDLVRSGKVRYVGLSNTPAWAVARMATIAEYRHLAPVVALQVEYSLVRRTVEGELFGAAREFGLGVLAYSPLASGVLSGKYSREDRNPQDSGRGALAEAQLGDRTFDIIDVLRRVADANECSVAAAALAWVRQQPALTSTILGVRSLKQLQANLDSLAVTLPDEALQELDKVSAPDLNYPFPWLDTIATPLQQGGTEINGIGAAVYRRNVK